jgi:hypothetical protein
MPSNTKFYKLFINFTETNSAVWRLLAVKTVLYKNKKSAMYSFATGLQEEKINRLLPLEPLEQATMSQCDHAYQPYFQA